jgi:hypothetical protein
VRPVSKRGVESLLTAFEEWSSSTIGDQVDFTWTETVIVEEAAPKK